MEAETKSLGPAFTGGFPDQTRFLLYGDSLLEIAPGKDIVFVPAMATSWTLLPGDGKTWEIKLRKGIKNHDGSALTAADVKYVVEWHQNKDNKSTSKSAEVAGIASIEAVDSETVRMTTKLPDPTFPGIWFNHYFFPKQYLEAVGAVGFGEKPVGPGPYKFVSRKLDDRLVVEAFNDYYGGRPAYDQVTVFSIPDAATRVAAIRANDVDITVKPPVEELAGLKKDQNLKVTVYDTPALLFYYVDIKTKPFDDLRVRKAMLHSIDYAGLNDGVMLGLGRTLTGFVPQGMKDHNPNLTPYEFNPQKSKQLLAEAGASNAPIKVIVSKGRYLQDAQIGEATANMLAQGGFKPELVTNEWSKQLDCLYTEYGTCPGGLLMMGGSYYTLDGMALFRRYFLTKLGSPLTGQKRGFYHEPFEQLGDKAFQEVDPVKRSQMVQELERIAWQDMLTILPITVRTEILVTRPTVEFVPRAVEYLYLKDAKPRQ